ncbi:MAG: excisionase family DNA-binding protein [Ilumatobacteraceae bacterium]|nr:excisionase family DNA-binding protein [Ilumatobacteraceae bacterium]
MYRKSAKLLGLRSGREIDLRLLLAASEAAHRPGIGRSLLYELLAGGQIEFIHVGRLRRIPTDALATYIEEHCGSSGKPITRKRRYDSRARTAAARTTSVEQLGTGGLSRMPLEQNQ